MKRKSNHHNMMKETNSQEEPNLDSESSFNSDTDICQQLMSRYTTSTAPQHRHLLATAAAIRSIISAESLPLTPAGYFAAAMDYLSDCKTLDSTAISSLLSFVSIVVPLIPAKEIKKDKVREAVAVLVEAVEIEELGVSSVRCVVKCLGALVLGFCDLEDWSSLEKGFKTVLMFSVDKRPKVRRCALESVEKFLESFQSSMIVKEASKMVLSLLMDYMPLALKLREIGDESKDGPLSKPQNLEVVHMLNLLKHSIQYLAIKWSSKILSEVLGLMLSHFSILTRHIFKVMEEFLRTSKDEVIRQQTENIINSLVLYISSEEKNPTDTILAAATLLRLALDRPYNGGSSTWKENFPKVCCSIAGFLKDEGLAAQSSAIAKELIDRYIGGSLLLNGENPSFVDVYKDNVEVEVIKKTCYVFESTLGSCEGIPNEHLLEVITLLFQKLGETSHIFLKNIVIKLADLMNGVTDVTACSDHLQNCIGSAIAAMGPEKMLSLVPICFNQDDFTCLNSWLIPILKIHITGASIAYYMENIVPLAQVLGKTSKKVKNSVISQDLQAHSLGLRRLLSAFCRYPVDCHRKFGSLAELLIGFLGDSSMLEDIAIALQVLVTQNRSVLVSDSNFGKGSDADVNIPTHYTKKIASKNIKALESYSSVLLQALFGAFVDSSPEKRTCLKDAIGCVASISDSSVVKNIFISVHQKSRLVNEGKFVKPQNDTDESSNEDGNIHTLERINRSMMLELASSVIEGAKEDLVYYIYDFVVNVFEAADGTNHSEAYHTLSRILEKHSWFCTLRLLELIDLLTSLKPPIDVLSLRSRFACLRVLMFHIVQMGNEEENTKTFLILNEIIITLKDAREEARKVAYDTLVLISSLLRDTSAEAYKKLISMIMGYFSGSSPQIKSGAVSALSVMVYNDTAINSGVPDLVPSLLALLQSKAIEVIKAVLGFVKVLVSTLQFENLHSLLLEILSEVLPWSLVSRNHFRSKVTTILEILIRKCGSAMVESMAPEKYKNFIKNVVQNRHHKPNEKHIEDSSTNRPNKRTHEALGSLPNENGSVNHQNVKRQKKQSKKQAGASDSHTPSAGELDGIKGGKHFKPNNLLKKQLKDTKNKYFESSTRSVKRKMEHQKMNCKGKAGHRKHGCRSKSQRGMKIKKN